MLEKELKIKTNLLTILIICIFLAALVGLCLTNAIPNLMFATITAKQVDTVTVYEQHGEKTAILSETDTKILCDLLQNVHLQGCSARLYIAESFNPQYTFRLKSGIQFDIACYSDHYIVNGKGYAVEDTHIDNYTAIGQQYLAHLGNRAYFPREADKEEP